MHELSIAMEILDIVAKAASEHGSDRVKSVRLRVGDLSGVEVNSLTFSFDAIKGERELTGDAELIVEKVPLKVHCRSCARDFAGEGQYLTCPACEGFDTEMLCGDELSVVDIEVE